ncbi:MAG: TIGR02597 family protein [Verrucomicrobia bacterium]|nr:TIGR02597 family protein [Verrucomicrobiota bacterium]
MRSSLAALFGGALLFAGAAVAPAQSVVTEPVGFTTLTVAARPTATRSFTYVALNMFRPTAYRGVVSSTAGTTLTFPANSFTANQFTSTAQGLGLANAHFIEVTNGAGAGVIADIVSNTTNTITLSEDISAFLTGGTSTIRIRPHWTIGTALPTAGFQSAATASNADKLTLVNGSTGALTTYFVHTTGQWRAGASNAADVVLRPDVGLLFERQVTSGTGVSFTLTGEVKLGATEIAVYGGAAQKTTLVPNPYPLASRQLNQLNLFTNNVATGLVGGNTAAQADNLVVIAAGGSPSTTYFLHTTGQIRVGASDRSTDTIPEGAAVLIVRKAGRGDFAWVVPAPTMNL